VHRTARGNHPAQEYPVQQCKCQCRFSALKQPGQAQHVQGCAPPCLLLVPPLEGVLVMVCLFGLRLGLGNSVGARCLQAASAKGKWQCTKCKPNSIPTRVVAARVAICGASGLSFVLLKCSSVLMPVNPTNKYLHGCRHATTGTNTSQGGSRRLWKGCWGRCVCWDWC
jgi:hypothetical protein